VSAYLDMSTGIYPKMQMLSICTRVFLCCLLLTESLLHILESYGPEQFAAALVGDSGGLPPQPAHCLPHWLAVGTRKYVTMFCSQAFSSRSGQPAGTVALPVI
jgi:hypothetical protein